MGATPASSAKLRGVWDWQDWVFFFYFLTHIPITYAIDLSPLLPPYAYPAFMRGLRPWYIEQFEDPLFVRSEPWFLAILGAEGLLQLPFFFLCVHAWLKTREYIRIPALIYAAHVITTMIPIYGTLIASPTPAFEKRMLLISVYAPYLIVPLMLLVRTATRTQMWLRPKVKE